jgi:hypothetical protein
VGADESLARLRERIGRHVPQFVGDAPCGAEFGGQQSRNLVEIESIDIDNFHKQIEEHAVVFV